METATVKGFSLTCNKCDSDRVRISVTYGTGSQTRGEIYVTIICRDCSNSTQVARPPKD